MTTERSVTFKAFYNTDYITYTSVWKRMSSLTWFHGLVYIASFHIQWGWENVMEKKNRGDGLCVLGYDRAEY